MSDFVANKSVKVPFEINEKFLCDPSRFLTLQKAIEDELASIEWDLNSPLLNAHINPTNCPISSEIEFFSDGIRSQIREYLLLKFALILVQRKYVDFETENAQKIVEEWLKEMLNILLVKIMRENRLVHQQALESIEFIIDFKEDSQLPSADDTKRMRQRISNSGDSSRASNSPSLENLSLRNQQTAKQFNKWQSDAKKSFKKQQTLINRRPVQELLWKKSMTKTGQSHSKGKKEKVKQKSAENYSKETLERVEKVSDRNIDELNDVNEKGEKVQKDDKSHEQHDMDKSDGERERGRETISTNNEPYAPVKQTVQQNNIQGNLLSLA